LLSGSTFALASDPKAPVSAPVAEIPTPMIELAVLENAVGKLEASARAYDTAYAAKGAMLPAAARARLNASLLGIDQALLIPEGLPGRIWYRHALYAPGRFTGYGAKTLPGVREAVEERRFADANVYAGRTAAAIERLARKLDTARGIIG